MRIDFIKIFIFFIVNSFFYKIYLKIPTKIDFIGVENFNPLPAPKKQKRALLSIDNNYFSKNKKKFMPLQMHSFEWLTEFKKVGGIDLLKKSRELIIDWEKCNFNLSSNYWDDLLVARRMVNLSINFDFYGSSAEIEFKKKITNIIFFHFKHLFFLYKLQKNNYEIDIEISKSLLIIIKIFGKKNNFNDLINLIRKQIKYQNNNDKFHKSINVIDHARFIHQLLEIRNILLFNKIKIWPELNLQIQEMVALLNNLFHKDQSLPLFNGTNNNKSEYVKEIAKLEKDIKIKNLFKAKDGLIVVEANKAKLFFDITKPNSKLLNQNLHSGTLSFELSYNNEKIITNCGASDKYIGKKQVFFRYSAAHSTLTINNTNIAELSEKNGYKRIPTKITNNSEEFDSYYIVSGTHNGYNKNYNILVKRTLRIFKNGKSINGTDQIYSLKSINKNNSYQIRFHLMPSCDCIVTNNDQKIIIKTKNGNAWNFQTFNNKLLIEESIYMGNGNHALKTKQILLTGYTTKVKNTINWELKKIN